MINELELEKQAERHALIKKTAEKLKLKQAAERVEKRRRLEDLLYLKARGVEL